MSSALRRLWWLLCDTVSSPQEVRISGERINVEDRAAMHRALEGDVEYRAKVKRRMTQGKACADPPLVDRSRVLAQRQVQCESARGER